MQLEFSGQNTGEKKAAQRESSRDLQRSSFKSLLEYNLCMCVRKKPKAEARTTRNEEQSNPQSLHKAGNSLCSH